MHCVSGDKLMIYKHAGAYRLPEEARQYFKEPLGKLYQNEEEIKTLITSLKSRRLTKLISVGDATTKKLLDNGLVPDIAIIDGLEKRQSVELINTEQFMVYEAQNPAGNITIEAWKCINEVMKLDDNKIIIKIVGEEDLTVLPAVLEAPESTKILYGQPNKGLVVVEVNEKKKKEVEELLKKMVRIDGL